MPTISSFYGVIIIMYPRSKEHNPPHVHAITAEHHASFTINEAEIMENAYFPPTAKKMVKKFILKHKDELAEMWETGNYRRLEPLQ